MAASGSPSNEIYWFELLNATNVPKADTLSESDPYVEVWLEWPQGVQITNTATSVTVKDDKNPFWYQPLTLELSPHLRGQPPPPAAEVLLHLSLFDRDPDKSDFLGHADVPLAQLPADGPPAALAVAVHAKYASRAGRGGACRVFLQRRARAAGLALEVVGAANCPKADLQSESDPYCVVRLLDAEGRAKAPACRTIAKLDAPHPTWREYCHFYAYASPGDTLRCEVADLNLGTSDTSLGAAELPAAALAERGQELVVLDVAPSRREFREKMAAGRPFQLELRPLRAALGQGRAIRRMYFVRHGESVWNEATDNKEVGRMLAHDHPLSAEGVAQAQRLRDAWQRLASQEPDFLRAQHVFSSPLTRALQTCTIGLRGHPLFSAEAPAAPSLRLLASAREVKTLVGLDTIGVAHGLDGILARLRQMTEPLLPLAELVPACHVDAYQCSDRWWYEGKEGKADMLERYKSFLNTLLYFPSSEHAAVDPFVPVIVVGHSLFFRDFCKAYLGDNPALAEFAQKKLCNAGCVRVDIEWNPQAFHSLDPKILNITLLFGSTLLSE